MAGRTALTKSFAALALWSLASLPGRAHAAGEIYWFSLLTEDVRGASQFYSELFGWDIVSSPTGGWMALRDGLPFAGINSIEDRIPGTSESLWLAAISVTDTAASVATAKRLGATIRQDVTELAGWGTYSVIQDPQGAPLLLVKPARVLGGTEGYSGWRWAELWTPDTKAAADFYSQVVGYELEAVPVGNETYDVFRTSAKRHAGLVGLDRAEIAPRWAPYVGVTDLRGILVRVWQAGGSVLREPAEVDFAAAGANRVALVADPSGAALFLYQLDERATSDPGAIADARRASSMPPPPPASSGDGPNIRVSVSVGVGYGFGPGWGSAYPAYLRPTLGPY
jgi:predicted enzyme related to lactoylglutathione lyase